MADFIKAFHYMIVNEDSTLSGKIYPDNNGALTRFGLNAAANPSLKDSGYYDQNPDRTPRMPNATALLLAQKIYCTKYWTKVQGEQIVSQLVADKMFDCEVNTGDAPKLLQHYLHSITPMIVVDGYIGPKTLAFVNSLDPAKVLVGFVLWWNWYITQELKNNPADKEYEKNWRARANKYPPLS